VKAAAAAAEDAWESTPYAEMAAHAWPNAIRAAWPLIAARVCAEIQESHERRIGRVRAEERQRITDDVVQSLELGVPEAAVATLNGHTGGCACLRCGRIRRALAAASAAPVATPEPSARLALLGSARMVLDQCAMRENPADPDGTEPGRMAQRIVDVIGHSVTDTPPVATPTEPATATTPGGVTIPASVCLTCADQWFECPDCGGSRHRAAEQDGQR
jgi:hypothetical protein